MKRLSSVVGLLALLISPGNAQPVCPYTPTPTAYNTMCANTAFVWQLNGGFVVASSVSFNALGDTVITINPPAAHYRVRNVVVKGISGTFGTAQAGLFTAPSQGGAAIAPKQVISINSVADNVVGDEFSMAINSISLTESTLYFNVGTIQNAVGNVYIYIQPET